MSKRTEASCSSCYFRQAGLCALLGETPCPTYRYAIRRRLVPPRQAPLVARQADPLTSHPTT